MKYLESCKQSNIYKAVCRWVEINLSWFMINGRKQEEHEEYLRKKYNIK